MFLATRGCILAALRAVCINNSEDYVDSLFANLTAARWLRVATPAFGGSQPHWSLVFGGKQQDEEMAYMTPKNRPKGRK